MSGCSDFCDPHAESFERQHDDRCVKGLGQRHSVLLADPIHECGHAGWDHETLGLVAIACPIGCDHFGSEKGRRNHPKDVAEHLVSPVLMVIHRH